MNPHLENSGFAFLFATQVLPHALAMVVLIAEMSANMSYGSSDAIASVSIILRDLYTLINGHMPAEDKAIRLSRIMLVVGLALLFALTSNDIISYITKMISMIMSGMFVCPILGRFWRRFNWQGAVAALVGVAAAASVVLMDSQWLAFWGNPCFPSVLFSLLFAVVATLVTPASKLSREEALELITRERENHPAPVILGKKRPE
ncbi:sodium/panthothenate symporter [Sodalis glossinidius str. 'morsitans']|uniref:Sodium/panthothenate symporter n=1 Tax=Sodalis glossinidius (strain morsitans) TaxID=343509 RepID=A0A193QGR8_SODGM|nr:sodium/panthothenate symporter [Sodalis glossinidius str. 'morsitans']